MANEDERGYLISRANAERELAIAATDPAVARIHNQLADEYEERTSDPTDEKPALRKVGEGSGSLD